jgi:hypothetical protein
LRKPSVERLRLERITSPFQFDASANFGQNQHTGSDMFGRRLINPTNDIWVGTLALAYFGNDVGVEEKFHKSTSRQPSRRG